MKTINNELIRTFSPCYDPSEKNIPDDETLTVNEWIDKYREVVPAEDIVWLLMRNHFMSDKDLRLFAVWCARETYALCEDDAPIDQRSIEAVDVAERYANGEATDDELSAARSAALSAAESAARSAVRSAAWSAARSAAWSAALSAAWSAALSAALSAARSAAESAAWSAARSKQVDKLKTYFV
jgi:hypothetical protein